MVKKLAATGNDFERRLEKVASELNEVLIYNKIAGADLGYLKSIRGRNFAGSAEEDLNLTSNLKLLSLDIADCLTQTIERAKTLMSLDCESKELENFKEDELVSQFCPKQQPRGYLPQIAGELGEDIKLYHSLKRQFFLVEKGQCREHFSGAFGPEKAEEEFIKLVKQYQNGGGAVEGFNRLKTGLVNNTQLLAETNSRAFTHAASVVCSSVHYMTEIKQALPDQEEDIKTKFNVVLNNLENISDTVVQHAERFKDRAMRYHKMKLDF